ncbi:DUF5809 family protein [Halanaeroarchaeum sulfurireducens]|uniref:Uncharacterized protein n=1 Tax=Halanaeroarchaeum sulfurireducens TaxID=1604004 RepID=A0A0F7P876_9EURY|nr:DUF5809 family protein [Halanaeroarchaeum sulfurireducens]AKH96927.1 hypothetical protein HLASF_0421 [Halanaeroarchaeum sulfurireducens]ALG81329.1 hypothetical protein HLASA_0420 [Halanaeroarchaeum sulfurireducens]
METRGLLAPETAAAARTHYETLGPAAQTVTREVTKAMSFDREEYRERVTGEVVGTAREALFASLLRVRVGTREEYESWLDDHPDVDAHVEGSEHVDRVAWHPVPFEDRVAAVTFQNEPDAAVATLQRQAFGRHYRPLF